MYLRNVVNSSMKQYKYSENQPLDLVHYVLCLNEKLKTIITFFFLTASDYWFEVMGKNFFNFKSNGFEDMRELMEL